MPNSQRHHFVPKFYLRRWYVPGENGFWLYYRDPNGCLRLSQRPAKAVGFADGLYSLIPDGVHIFNGVSEELEENFFQRIDSMASRVHEKLLSKGVSSLNASDRQVWALFVNSLIERNPKRIEEVSNQAAGTTSQIITQMASRSRDFYGNTGLKTVVNSIAVEASDRNAALIAISRFIIDEAFINYICEMQWLTVDLPRDEDHYWTSDAPVLVNLEPGTYPIFLMALALSPKRLLVMHKKTEEFDLDFCKHLALGYNILLAENANKYLVSSRKLIDGESIKYTRIINELFGKT